MRLGIAWKLAKSEPARKVVQKQDDDGLYYKMDDGDGVTGTKSQSYTILFVSWKRKETPEEEANSQSRSS